MSLKSKLTRRGFLKRSMKRAIGGGMVAISSCGEKHQESQIEKTEIKNYRTLGRTGFKVSDIGYGAGPLTNANVLRAALHMGVNYIDTAEHYGNGRSERTVGDVLKKFDRKSIFLTTKLNLTFRSEKKEDIKQRFNKCLERLQTDYVDCLMTHMVPTVESVTHEGFHEVVQQLKTEGKVRFIGISNHGLEHRLAGDIKEPMEKVLLAAAEDGRFDVVLFVYNFLQKEQGEIIIRACKAKNMGITLMKTNPVNFYISAKRRFDSAKEKGEEIPNAKAQMLKEYSTRIGQAEEFKKKYGLKTETQVRDAAIKFVLSHSDVHTVCPSINTFYELETFVALSGQKLQAIDISMLNDYEKDLSHVYCRHACGICEAVCPHNIPVNTIMRYNHYFEAQGREKHAMLKYASLSKTNEHLCENCEGLCVTACPYNVPIQGLLMLAHQNLTLG